MSLTSEHVREFCRIYQERYGIQLSDADALKKLGQLVSLVELVYQPITFQQFEATRVRQQELGVNNQVRYIDVKTTRPVRKRTSLKRPIRKIIKQARKRKSVRAL